MPLYTYQLLQQSFYLGGAVFVFPSEAEVIIGGGGHFNSPPNVTNDYLITSSFKSISYILDC